MKTFLRVITFFVGVYVMVVLADNADDEPLKRIFIHPEEGISSNETSPSDHMENKHHISSRKSKACDVPTVMKKSQLDCRVYTSRISCTQTCIFGHTLKEGIQREMSCRMFEDKWEPVPEFEECKPFVDCDLDFQAGAHYECRTNFMEKGPECKISCKQYEDIPAVPEKMYKCNVDGKWDPPLPFCAKPHTGTELVPPPEGPKVVSVN